MNAAIALIGYFLLSIGVLVTLARMDGVPLWGTMAAGFVLAGLGVLFVLRRFTLDGGSGDGSMQFHEPPTDTAHAAETPTALSNAVPSNEVPSNNGVRTAPPAHHADEPGGPQPLSGTPTP